jgi:hypothetical protein
MAFCSAVWRRLPVLCWKKQLRRSNRRQLGSWKPPVSSRITCPELEGELSRPCEPMPTSQPSLLTRAMQQWFLGPRRASSGPQHLASLLKGQLENSPHHVKNSVELIHTIESLHNGPEDSLDLLKPVPISQPNFSCTAYSSPWWQRQ